MAINSKTAAALVAAGDQAKGKTMLVKLTRDIYIAGKLKKAGAKLEVPLVLGSELISANKAEKFEKAESLKKDEGAGGEGAGNKDEATGGEGADEGGEE